MKRALALRERSLAQSLAQKNLKNLWALQTLAREPGLILLDEPYQGFDEDSYLIFRSQLLRWRDRGAGILMITHMLHDLDDIDHVIELHPREDL